MDSRLLDLASDQLSPQRVTVTSVVTKINDAYEEDGNIEIDTDGSNVENRAGTPFSFLL